MVGHMVSTVPPKAEETIMTMRSPSGIHPAYQHGSDADVGNQILYPDTVSDLGDVRPAVGALHANQAHSGDMGATSPVPSKGAYGIGSLQEQSGQLN